MPENHQSVTLEEARKIIAAATKKAKAIGQPMNIAVACAGGHLLAFEPHGGAMLGSAVSTSLSKKHGPPALLISRPALLRSSANPASSSSASTHQTMAKS